MAPNKVNIHAGDEVKSFFVLLVSLKRKGFDEKRLQRYLAIYHTKIMQTAWKPTEEQRIELQGLNLDRVWENLIVAVGRSLKTGTG